MSAFNFNQGLRQGCVLSLDLLNVFFAAGLTATFDRFSINKAAVQDFIRIAERGAKTRDKLSQAPRVMLYADDADIASTSQVGLAETMTALHRRSVRGIPRGRGGKEGTHHAHALP